MTGAAAPAGEQAALLELEVGAAAAGGACVARAPDGRVVFVRYSLPGERVRARVTATTAHFLRADAVEVLTASPDRVEPPCPYARPGRCGGCDWQHVALPRQRLLKAGLVAEQLRRTAGVEREVVVEPVPGDRDGLDWRTRVTFGVGPGGRPGLHRHRSHELEPVEECLIAAPGVERVGAERLRWPGAASVEVATTAPGDQRVVAVARRARGRLDVPEVDAGAVVDGAPVRAPHGLRHEVLGHRFEVSAGGFWQVHTGAAATLASVVLEVLAPRPGERVLDLYAGVALFGALLGRAVGPDGAVLAVEADARACADAARNTADLPQVRVRTAAVEPALLERLPPAVGPSPDLVVLDPPRAGAGLAVTAALARLRPRRLAYVSCDPASFARDARVLLDAGWSMPVLRAFDCYPMTEHTELVAVFEPPGVTRAAPARSPLPQRVVPHAPLQTFRLRRGRLRPGQADALDRLWPRLGVDVDGSPLDLAQLFGADRPVVLEIGSGMGEATARAAAADPARGLLAVDVHTPGHGNLLRLVEEAGLDNVRVADGDARVLLGAMLPPGALDEVRVWFPDPWPKARHAKRRLVDAALLRLVASRLRPGGLVHVATDWPPYAEAVLAALAQVPELELVSRARPASRPTTRFEQRALDAGRPVADLLARRLSPAVADGQGTARAGS